MGKQPDQDIVRYGLPYVVKATAEELLREENRRPDLDAQEWQELSDTNPYLRDYITIIANRAEPEDLKARQKIIHATLSSLRVARNALVIQQLNERMGTAFSKTIPEPASVPSDLELPSTAA